jgi:hypothetical protein
MSYGNYGNQGGYGGGQRQQRDPQKPGNGRVWPTRQRRGPNSPNFTGEITLPDGHVMRVSLWEAYKDRGNGPFNGFSIKLSEDTRQGSGYHAQGGYSNNAGGYGQPQGQGGYGNRGGYGGGNQGGYGRQEPPPNNQGYGGGGGYGPPQDQGSGYGDEREFPPTEAYNDVPGFDDR